MFANLWDLGGDKSPPPWCCHCTIIVALFHFVKIGFETFWVYSFGHLLKTVELVKDKIPFFWYYSTENGRLTEKPILLAILFLVDFQEIIDRFFWALQKMEGSKAS